jgi:hypothetical protein
MEKSEPSPSGPEQQSSTDETLVADPEQVVQPRVVYGQEADRSVRIDAARAAVTMAELGLSEDKIKSTTIYVDAKYHASLNGSTYPNRLGRARFKSEPELREAPGSIVQMSTLKKGEPRTDDEMNKTLVHELEHVAQSERGDYELQRGSAVIAGLTAAGALLGRLASKNAERKSTRLFGLITGALAGYQVGYKVSPHERHARQRSEEVTTDAIKRIDQT